MSRKMLKGPVYFIISLLVMGATLNTVTPVTAVSNNYTRLTGAPFGTSPAWSAGREYDKATDGDSNTFFDYASANGGYTGIDLGAGNAKRVTRIIFYPRKGFWNGGTYWNEGPPRMVGGKFQGSNTSQSSGYTDLYTITTAPAPEIMSEVAITDPNTYRYLRYLGPDGGYGNIAEVQFFTTDGTPAQSYSMELVQGSSAPLIDSGNPGSAGNQHGYEGGTVFMYKSEFHMFVTEELTGWDLTRTGHWKSTDGSTWTRVSTVQNSVNIPNDPRHAIWSPMPFYNTDEGRWNLFYVGYEQNGCYYGRVFRAYSSVNGYDGLDGPYTDAAGTVLSYTDSNKDPWEGSQGADSFYVYKAGNTWWGFYGSYGTSYQWCTGLASASSLAGSWSRDAISQPTFSYAENPIVITLNDGAYFCVYDDLAHGISNCHSIGYGYSSDGINWTQKYLDLPMPSWATNVRTPQSLIPAGNNEYWVYFTANTASGFDCVGRMKVRIVINNNTNPALLSDDFSGDLSKWQNTANALISGGQLTVTNNESMQSVAGGADWTDYSLQADLKITNINAGLVFRKQDDNNFYMWQFSSSGELNPHKKVNGSWTVIKRVPAGLTVNTTYNVRIEAIGNTIKTYLNGNLIDTTTENTFVGGKVGFRECGSETGVFDNILVSTEFSAPRIFATASSTVNGSWPAGNAIDNNTGNDNGWSSAQQSQTGSQSISVDLGANYNLTKIKIVPRTHNNTVYCFPQDFKFQYSTNGTTWTDIPGQSYTNYPDPANNHGEVFTLVAPINARYLQMVGTKYRVDDFGHYYLQISEIYLYYQM